MLFGRVPVFCVCLRLLRVCDVVWVGFCVCVFFCLCFWVFVCLQMRVCVFVLFSFCGLCVFVRVYLWFLFVYVRGGEFASLRVYLFV